MTGEKRHEEDGIRAVVSRLVDAFSGSCSADQVKATVDAHYRRFDGSRVRTYVPLLVEHGAREELSSHVTPAGLAV
jgi:hypothetical protein